MTAMITNAEFIERAYTKVPKDAVVSSGHAFLLSNRKADPPARTIMAKRIERTLRSLADHALVPIEPRVWRTEDRHEPIRLDGYGPSVDMDADAARLAVIDALGAPEAPDDVHESVVGMLHAIASTVPATTSRISCFAPMPWRPASIDTDPSSLPQFAWWSGTDGWAHRPATPVVERTVLDPGTAMLLPRMVVAADGRVTLDDRFGMLLRPLAWAGRTHQALDPMGIIRAHAALADMLARHPVRRPVHEPAHVTDADTGTTR